MTNWLAIIRARIMANLKAAPISEAAKDEIVKQAIEDTEAGRAFGTPPDEEKKPAPNEDDDDPITSRGEKLSVLRKEGHKWGGWEDRWPSAE